MTNTETDQWSGIVSLLKAEIARDGRSMPELSRVSGIGRTMVQALSVGYRIVDGETRLPLRPRPTTVARMAQVLGIPAAAVREAGAEKAAEIMMDDPPLSQASTAQLAEELNKRLHGQSSD